MSGHSHRPTLKQASRTNNYETAYPSPRLFTTNLLDSGIRQKNKGFKSRHATKSSLKNAAKGKVDNASPSTSSASSTHRAKAAAEKKNRMNHRAQIRQTHHKAIGQDSKFFSTVSGGKGVPRIVSVIPLHSAVRCEDFGKSFVEVLGLGDEEKERVERSMSDRGSWIMRYG
jgi:pre-rRNA-processing protein TSR1